MTKHVVLQSSASKEHRKPSETLHLRISYSKRSTGMQDDYVDKLTRIGVSIYKQHS